MEHLDRELYRNGSGYADPTAYKAIQNCERSKRKVAWQKQKYNKYGSKKVEVDGMTFASKKEARRYKELVLLEKSGAISNLKMQVKYILIPAQREPDTIGARGGVHKGKIIEKECAYYADFVYFDREKQEVVVEDTKGMRTTEYIIKRKLMLHVHGIRIREI